MRRAGCFVNPQHPAAVAARGLGGFRIAQAVFGALAKALPERVPAAWGGGEFGVSFGGYYPAGRAFVFLEFNNDGPRGGGPACRRRRRPDRAGAQHGQHPDRDHRSRAAAAHPPLWLGARHRRPGPLPRRPGPGARVPAHARRGQPSGPLRPRPVPALGHSGRLVRDGRRQPAQPGPRRWRRTASRQVPAHAEAWRRVPAWCSRAAAATATRWERAPEAVREDAAQGKISAAHARDAYGVVLASGWPGRHVRHHRAAGAPPARTGTPLSTEPRVQRAEDGAAGGDPSYEDR